ISRRHHYLRYWDQKLPLILLQWQHEKIITDGGRPTSPPPLPPPRPRKHHASLEDHVHYWNQVLTKAFIAIIRCSLILLGLVVLALLAMIAFKDNNSIMIVIFAAHFILALNPVVIVV